VRSVPTELNKDHSGILGLAQVCAFHIVIILSCVTLYNYMMIVMCRRS
jgi:hypothetical protein